MNRPSKKQPASQVLDVVMRYLSERLNADAISTAGALMEVRKQIPDCPLTDEEIIAMVTEKAVEAGFAVEFENIDHSVPG